MKSAKSYLEEANAVVPRLEPAEAIKHHGEAGAVFIDVRDSADIAKSGTIAGAARIPRGFMEFAADPDLPFYNPVLKKDAPLYLVCGAGGQAALAGKTLKDMGYKNVTNVGGIGDWKEAGGPTEDG
ncbi:MAG: rhodanese-like domain-containing protein [Pseudomonadota bacterium]